MKAPKSLQQNILYQIGEVNKLMHRRITEAFQKGGFSVTVEQFSLLAVLWYEEGISQMEIARRLDKDKTTITRIIKNMKKGGLLLKKDDPEDGRGNLIFLTDKGKQIQKEMVQASGEVYFKALQGVLAADLEMSSQLLRRIAQNLT